LSSLANISCLSSRFSGTASTTMSASAASSSSHVVVMLARAASDCSPLILSLERNLPRELSIASIPETRQSSLMSHITIR